MPPTPAGRSSATPALEAPIPQMDESLEDDDENAIVLDPKNSERQHWRDPMTGIVREIWRPGDGPGKQSAEGWELKKVPPDIKQRWRFYQSSTGPIRRFHNEPPRFVVLDDKAAYEVLQSDIPRTHLPIAWNLDFGGGGTIRQKRVHRGRGAIGDPDAEGNDKYHFGYHGNKKDQYYFTGESKDSAYRPVIYREAAITRPNKRKAEDDDDDVPTVIAPKKAKTGSNPSEQGEGPPNLDINGGLKELAEGEHEPAGEQEVLPGNASPEQTEEGIWVEQHDEGSELADEGDRMIRLVTESGEQDTGRAVDRDTSDDEFPFRRQPAATTPIHHHAETGSEVTDTSPIKVEDEKSSEADSELADFPIKVEDGVDSEDEQASTDSPLKAQDHANHDRKQHDADGLDGNEVNRDTPDLQEQLSQAQLTIDSQTNELDAKNSQLAQALRRIAELKAELSFAGETASMPREDALREESRESGDDEVGVKVEEEGG